MIKNLCRKNLWRDTNLKKLFQSLVMDSKQCEKYRLRLYVHTRTLGQSAVHWILTVWYCQELKSLLLDRRSIDHSGAREKKGHFHYKNFLTASKWGITCHTCSIIPKSLYCGLGLIPILSKGILGSWSRYGMWYLILKLSKSFYNESDLLFLVHHWGRLTSHLRGVS